MRMHLFGKLKIVDSDMGRISNSSLTIAIVVLLSTTIVSCIRNTRSEKYLDYTETNDSLSISISDTIILDIGSFINPIPFHDVIITENNEDYYLLEDEGKISIFNISRNKLVKEFTLSSDIKMDGLSGLTYKDGLLWVYDYKNRRVLGVDSTSQCRADYLLPKVNDTINTGVMSDMPMIVNDSCIYLSGVPMMNPYSYENMYPTTLKYSRTSGYISFEGKRGFPYDDKDFFCGYDNMWRVYMGEGDGNSILISSPLNPSLLKFDQNMNYIGKFDCSSRYADSPILSCDDSNFDENKDRDYYYENHTYRAILFDNNKSLYYRIATHPSVKKNDGRYKMKPFSIIVASGKGNVLAETPVIDNNNKYFYDKVYVSSKGLMMQISSSDETKIKFVVFKYDNSNENS